MNIHNLKHKELYEWYNKQSENKVKRAKFISRVIQYWYSKEEAIKDINWMSFKRRIKNWTIINENWRVCSKCKQFKEWNWFARTKNWINWYTCNCKECRNKAKSEYRKRTNYYKDHEYKKKKRILFIGDQIYFQDDVREVLSYKMKKWYIVKSILNGVKRRISTGDNHYTKNNICVRFKKLDSILKVKTTEELKKEQDLKEEQSVNSELFIK